MDRTLQRVIVAAVCAAAAALAAPAAASACTIALPQGPQSVDITVAKAEAAVVGTVLSSTAPDPADPGGYVDTVLAVEQVVKGPVAGPQITLRHATVGALCGFTMTTGERYGVVGRPAAGGGTFSAFQTFDETQLGKDPDLDGVPAAADTCPAVYNPAEATTAGGSAQPDADGDGIGDACEPPAAGDRTPPAIAIVRHAPARLGRLRSGGWAVRLRSDEAATALVELTARIGGERRLLASFAVDLSAGGGVRVPLTLGVAERALLRGRDRVDARVRVVARDAAGNAARLTQAVRFRRGG